MTEHRIATQEEWQVERDELLKEEKELTRRGDELARKRRELPWVPVEKDYRFETEDGTKTLADLFGGRSQLLVYHFMFGPAYEAGFPRAAREADRLQGADGLGHRLGLKRRQRLQPRPRLPIHRGGAEAVPGGRDPAHRRADGAHVRNGRGGLRHRGTGPERVRALGRDRLPNLPQHRARPRAGDGLLRAARSHAEGPRRERHGTALAAAPRRIRDEVAWLCGISIRHPCGDPHHGTAGGRALLPNHLRTAGGIPRGRSPMDGRCRWVRSGRMRRRPASLSMCFLARDGFRLALEEAPNLGPDQGKHPSRKPPAYKSQRSGLGLHANTLQTSRT